MGLDSQRSKRKYDVTSKMGSATITDTYRRDACLYSGLDVSTFAPSSSGATFPFTSCVIDSSISGSGVEPVLLVEVGADFAAVETSADVDLAAAGVVLRARVVAVAVVLVLASSVPTPASAFFAEAVVFVDADRVVFFTAGAGVSAGPIAAAGSDFFLRLLAGAAAAVLFVLIFFFGTLAAVVLLAALAGLAAVDAKRSGCSLQRGTVVMHRAHRPRRCDLRTREDIVQTGDLVYNRSEAGTVVARLGLTCRETQGVVECRIGLSGRPRERSRCREDIVDLFTPKWS
jgi:hypothetical protein